MERGPLSAGLLVQIANIAALSVKLVCRIIFVSVVSTQMFIGGPVLTDRGLILSVHTFALKVTFITKAKLIIVLSSHWSRRS